jgi:hypothetical protein
VSLDHLDMSPALVLVLLTGRVDDDDHRKRCPQEPIQIRIAPRRRIASGRGTKTPDQQDATACAPNRFLE